METSLRLLHPFMPFVTEEVWQSLRPFINRDGNPDSIVIAPYPVADTKAYDPAAEEALETVTDVIRSIRNTRAQYRVPSNKPVAAGVYSDRFDGLLKEYSVIIEAMAVARPLSVARRDRRPSGGEKSVVEVLKGAEVVVPMSGMVDTAAERQRLEKEIASLDDAIGKLEARLSGSAFVSQAPPAVVQKEKDRLASYRDKASRLRQELSQLS
jgi:valyl-tRNA synthetase